MTVRFLYSALLIWLTSFGLRAYAQGKTQTEFLCITNEPSGFATIARRGTSVTPPLILWQETLDGWTPEKRCQEVTDRLNKTVTQNGGKLGNLSLTYGTVNQQTVLCSVKAPGQSCTAQNMLFTLKPENAKNPEKTIEQIADFAMYGSGQPIRETEGHLVKKNGHLYFDLGIWQDLSPLSPEEK